MKFCSLEKVPLLLSLFYPIFTFQVVLIFFTSSFFINPSVIFLYLKSWENFSFLCADLKLHLQSTDYGNFLANEASPLQVSVIDDKLRDKLVAEFQHMRNHAVEPLATFLDYITYGYVTEGRDWFLFSDIPFHFHIYLGSFSTARYYQAFHCSVLTLQFCVAGT